MTYEGQRFYCNLLGGLAKDVCKQTGQKLLTPFRTIYFNIPVYGTGPLLEKPNWISPISERGKKLG